MTSVEFAKQFEDYLNRGGKGQREGRSVGVLFQSSHRTLQRLAIAFCLGIICGLGETDPRFTDARNEEAIKTAIKIKGMVDTGELNLGAYI